MMTEQPNLSPEQVKALVGYHNYFNIGTFEAQEKVQASCPEGWRALAATSLHVPDGAVRVGQVKVRHADPAFPLYVYPIKQR